MLELAYPTTTATFPLLPDTARSPKLLWLDTGLVNFMAGMQEAVLLTADTAALYNGEIAEHLVAQELLGSGTAFGEKRVFWVREARNSQAEVDFVVRHRAALVPVEVKTGDNSRLRSLHLFMAERGGGVAVRLWDGPRHSDTIPLPDGRSYTLHNLPLYYAGQMATFLDGVAG